LWGHVTTIYTLSKYSVTGHNFTSANHDNALKPKANIVIFDIFWPNFAL